MQVREKHKHHGAALAQIVEHQHFTALNKASAAYGHYRVNDDVILFIKYSGAERSPWQFTFDTEELMRLQDERLDGIRTFLVLVCGLQTVCALTSEETWQVLDASRIGEGHQTIHVNLPPGGSMRLKGTGGHLKNTVRHNRFPDLIFDAA